MFNWIKKVVVRWLELDKYIRDTELKGQLETRVDYLKIIDKKVAEGMMQLFCGTPTNSYYKSYYKKDDVNNVLTNLRKIIREEGFKSWKECERTNVQQVEDYIRSEEFLDKIVSRILSKQLGRD